MVNAMLDAIAITILDAINETKEKHKNNKCKIVDPDIQTNAWLLYDYSLFLLSGLESTLDDEYEVDELIILRSYSTAFKNLCVIQRLMDEINNGGLTQYYDNSSGEQYILVEQALKEVGMKELLTIMEKANPIMAKALKRTKGDKDDLEFTEKEDEKLEALSNEFYEIDTNGRQYDLLAEYIDCHLQDKIFDEDYIASIGVQ